MHRIDISINSTLDSQLMDGHHSILSSLRAIRNTAENLKRLTHFSYPLSNPVTPDISFPALELRYPFELESCLDSLSLSPDARSKMQIKIKQWVQKLQDVHSQNFNRACQELVSIRRGDTSPTILLENLRRAYQASYEGRYIPLIKSNLVELQSKSQRSCTNQRLPFNQRSTPLLEKYFAFNAYPTTADRHRLAKETNMTPRQIEVWFQNHRNRAKKDGRPFRRLTSPAMFDSFRDTPSVEGSEFTDDDISDEDISCETPPNPDELSQKSFSTTAPSHAFPTTYPPKCVQDPFPRNEAHFKFPPSLWRRRPAASQPVKHATDIDHLTADFAAKLSIRDVSYKKQKTAQPVSSRLWFSHRVIVPPRAPHPASCHPRGSRTSSNLFVPMTQPCSVHTKTSSTGNGLQNLQSKFPIISDHMPKWPSTLEKASTCSSRSSSTSSISSSSTEPLSPLLTPSTGTGGLSRNLDILKDNLLDELFSLEAGAFAERLDTDPFSFSMSPNPFETQLFFPTSMYIPALS